MTTQQTTTALAVVALVCAIGVTVPVGAATTAAQTPAAAAASAFKPITAEQAQPFLGDWTVTAQAPPGPVAFGLSLKVTDGKVAATIANEMMGNSTIPSENITTDGKALMLSYSVDMMGNAAKIVLTLVPAADKLNANFSIADGMFEMGGVATKTAK